MVGPELVFYVVLQPLLKRSSVEALEADLASGRWSVVTGFQDRMIWRYGAVYGFDETVERVTGKPLTVEDYTAYLADKYSTIYNLQ